MTADNLGVMTSLRTTYGRTVLSVTSLKCTLPIIFTLSSEIGQWSDLRRIPLLMTLVCNRDDFWWSARTTSFNNKDVHTHSVLERVPCCPAAFYILFKIFYLILIKCCPHPHVFKLRIRYNCNKWYVILLTLQNIDLYVLTRCCFVFFMARD